jgi:hypothetical protein
MRYQLLAISLLFCFGCNRPASEAKPSAQDSSQTNVANPQSEFVLLVGIRGEETKFPSPDAALIEEKLRSLDWTVPENRIGLNRKKGKDIDNMFIHSRDNQFHALHLAQFWVGGDSTTPTDSSKTFESLDTALQLLISHLNEDDEYQTIVEWEQNRFPRKSGALAPKP